jgi:hypothetical protein
MLIPPGHQYIRLPPVGTQLTVGATIGPSEAVIWTTPTLPTFIGSNPDGSLKFTGSLSAYAYRFIVCGLLRLAAAIPAGSGFVNLPRLPLNIRAFA